LCVSSDTVILLPVISSTKPPGRISPAVVSDRTPGYTDGPPDEKHDPGASW